MRHVINDKSWPWDGFFYEFISSFYNLDTWKDKITSWLTELYNLHTITCSKHAIS